MTLLPRKNAAKAKTKYSDRKCPFCRATPVTGHETHYLLACPSITPGMDPMYKLIKENLKRLTLPPWDGLDDNVKISLLLGSSLPPQLDKQKPCGTNGCCVHKTTVP